MRYGRLKLYRTFEFLKKALTLTEPIFANHASLVGPATELALNRLEQPSLLGSFCSKNRTIPAAEHTLRFGAFKEEVKSLEF